MVSGIMKVFFFFFFETVESAIFLQKVLMHFLFSFIFVFFFSRSGFLYFVVVYLFIYLFKPEIDLVGLKLKTLLLKGSGGGVGWEGAGSIPGELLHFQLFFLKLQLYVWFQSHLGVSRIRNTGWGSPFWISLLWVPPSLSSDGW